VDPSSNPHHSEGNPTSGSAIVWQCQKRYPLRGVGMWLVAKGQSYWLRHRAFLSEGLHSDGASVNNKACPMKGRRAPELANGELFELLQRWWCSKHAELLSICSHLSQKDRDAILQDWEVAKQTIAFSLTTKFSFASSLPFLLCGAAHHDEDTARKVMRECFQQYSSGQGTAASERPTHHRLTVKFCDPSSWFGDAMHHV
jgi:hypothetical protein